LFFSLLISGCFLKLGKKNYEEFSLAETNNPFLNSYPSAETLHTTVLNYKGISLYYVAYHHTAINNTYEYLIKYYDSTKHAEKFFDIEFNENPKWNVTIQKDTLILFYESNPYYLVVNTEINENGKKLYHREPVDEKNLAGYFFTPEKEGIFKSENNSWIPVNSYESEGRYMLTPFQYEKSEIVKISIDKILEAIKNY
jgi:hypothetical protein